MSKPDILAWLQSQGLSTEESAAVLRLAEKKARGEA